SVGFDAGPHNELGAAALTADHCVSELHAHIVRPRLDAVVDTLAAAFDEPFADPSAVPMYYLCRAAREHVTVALSGDGGDEAFAGYDFRYKAWRIEGWIRQTTAEPLRSRAAPLLSAVWPRSRRVPRWLRRGATLFENLSGSIEEAYYADLCF